MNLFQRITTSLQGMGFSATLVRLRAILTDHWFDYKYKVDTCAIEELNTLTISSNNKSRGYRYQAARVLPLRKLFKTIRPLFPSSSVLVDFGSGKGRIMLVASEAGFRDVRGVEFAHELCEIAQKNCDQYKRITKADTKFTIVESDAAIYKIREEENVFIMYNPFDDAIINKVLDNITTSVEKHPRQVYIIYYNPKWGQIIEQRPNFKSLHKFVFWGYKLTVYSNKV